MVVDKDDNLILADKSFLRMYSQDGKYIKECRLEEVAWDISYHKHSGRIVVALRSNGIQFVDSFTAQKKIIVQNITYCTGITWVDDNIYVGGCDEHGSCGRINILDSDGRHISSIRSSSSSIDYIHHRDNNIYYTYCNNVYCIKKDGSNLFTLVLQTYEGHLVLILTDQETFTWQGGGQTTLCACLLMDRTMI